MRKYLTLFFCLYLFFSCKKEDFVPTQDFLKNKERWESLNIQNYVFEYQHNCFCGPDYRGPFQIEVRKGKVYSVNGNQDLTSRSFLLPSIDSLFIFIEKVKSEEYETLSIEYDSNFSFPNDFWLDKNKMIADEEFGFSISDFKENK